MVDANQTKKVTYCYCVAKLNYTFFKTHDIKHITSFRKHYHIHALFPWSSRGFFNKSTV